MFASCLVVPKIRRGFAMSSIKCSAFLMLFSVIPLTASAQVYPAAPVRVVVAFATGGTLDAVARMYGQKLATSMGQPFVIENRVGAGGTIGTEAVTKSTPDGYTIKFGSTSDLAVSPNLYPNLSYDVLRDFIPVAQVASAPFALAIHASVPAKNIPELIALAKAKPGQINYASSGTGSSLHLLAEYLKYLAKIDLVHIPYKGLGPAIPDLISGRVQLLFSDMGPFIPFVKEGKLRVLAVSTAKRSKLYPDLPSIAEYGMPDYDLAGWYGVVVPLGTPRPVVEKLHAELMKAMRAPDIVERYAAMGLEQVEKTPEQFGAYMRTQHGKWGDIIKRSGTKLE